MEKNKGNEAFKSGDFEESINYYTNSIEIFPTVATYNNRGLASEYTLSIIRWSRDSTMWLHVLVDKKIWNFYAKEFCFAVDSLFFNWLGLSDPIHRVDIALGVAFDSMWEFWHFLRCNDDPVCRNPCDFRIIISLYIYSLLSAINAFRKVHQLQFSEKNWHWGRLKTIVFWEKFWITVAICTD